MQTPELDQSAIDALFMKSSSTAAKENGSNVVSVKFGSKNSISSSQMQGLTALVQLFARSASFRFSTWLGAVTKVGLISVERVLFSEFLGNIVPDENYVASWEMAPVDAPCLAYMDVCLIDPIIDLLLGGIGAASLRKQSTEITEIESAILDSVMQAMCAEFSNAWRSADIEVRHQKRLLSSYHSQAMPARDNALCLSFEVQVGTTQGSMALLFSGLASDTLLRAVAKQEIRRAPSQLMKQKLQEKSLTFRYGAILQLPIVKVSAHAVQQLRPGSFLPLQLSTETPATLLVAGKPMFHAQPVAAGLHKGAFLTQVANVSSSTTRRREEKG
ncbi:MAG TPA: flagellar motor switch protein FliM [Granulicella sp.]|jgi:flagellar motor switch protein FliM|nr:flagellar motor switch protein FliM [Granulicella sp.]